MAGGAPVPIPVSETILSIADLEEAASMKLGRTARGDFPSKLFLLSHHFHPVKPPAMGFVLYISVFRRP